VKKLTNRILIEEMVMFGSIKYNQTNPHNISKDAQSSRINIISNIYTYTHTTPHYHTQQNKNVYNVIIYTLTVHSSI